MSRERNPKDFYANRVLQLNNSTPFFGSMVRKKVVEEICNTRFVGWYSEKIDALVAALNNDDKNVKSIAENYLLSLDTNEQDAELIQCICEHYIETRDAALLRVIRKKKYNTQFDDHFKQIEFECSVFGLENTMKTIHNLTLEKAFNILKKTEIPDLKKFILHHLRDRITVEDIPEIFQLFLQDYNYCYCEFIAKFYEQLSFEDKIIYIENIPKLKDYQGNKEALLYKEIGRLNADIKANPGLVDAHFLIKRASESIFNDWMIDILVKNRPLLSMKNELAICNYFKEYDKVRDYLMQFNLEQLCIYYPSFVGTPIECMFAQKLRMAIKKFNYNFNFNMIKDFFDRIEENLKIEIFKMLSNFSTPQYYDFVLFQLNKIANYSKEEQRIYLEEIIPFYIPMYSRLPQELQIKTIENLPDLDFAALTFYVHSILQMKVQRNIIVNIENLLSVDRLKEEQKLVVFEMVNNQMPSLLNHSEIIASYKTIYETKLEEMMLMLGELEYQCSRQYVRDDRSGHNKDIDEQRKRLITEIQNIDLEKSIELLLPHYDEKNYRLKRDVKTILMGTKVGYRILIPYALTSAMENRDLRDFAVELLNCRIQPYLPFRPKIKMHRDHYRYVELFLSEKDLIFRELAKSLKRCDISSVR